MLLQKRRQLKKPQQKLRQKLRQRLQRMLRQKVEMKQLHNSRLSECKKNGCISALFDYPQVLKSPIDERLWNL